MKMTPAEQLAFITEVLDSKLISQHDALDILNGIDKSTSVEEWLLIDTSNYYTEKYPNAKKAADIKKLPLYKLL